METSALLKRITVNPAICHDKPCIRDLRYPVEVILELFCAGMTNDDILPDYEDFNSGSAFFRVNQRPTYLFP